MIDEFVDRDASQVRSSGSTRELVKSESEQMDAAWAKRSACWTDSFNERDMSPGNEETLDAGVEGSNVAT